MKKPLAWLVACCIVPVALTLGISVLSFRPSLYWLVSLICPILMIGSMWAMRSPEGGAPCCSDHEKQEVKNQ